MKKYKKTKVGTKLNGESFEITQISRNWQGLAEAAVELGEMHKEELSFAKISLDCLHDGKNVYSIGFFLDVNEKLLVEMAEEKKNAGA